jgi:hypothetical protein
LWLATILLILFCLAFLFYAFVQSEVASANGRMAVDATVELQKCKDETQIIRLQSIASQKEALAQHEKLLKAIDLATMKKSN